MHSVKKKRGFSLIELVVVFGIIGLLTSFSVAFYNNFKAKEAVSSVVSAFSSNLRLARERAVLVQKPDSACLDLNYWWLNVASDVLSIGANCNPGPVDYDFGETVKISGDVTVVMDKAVNFEPLTGSSSAGLVTITISSDAVALVRTIHVEASGVINEL